VHSSNESIPLPILEDPNSIYGGRSGITDPSVTPDRNNPPWGIGGAFFVLIVSFLLVAFLPLVFLIPYASMRGINVGNPNYLAALVQFAMNDKTAVLLQVVALLPGHLVTLLLVWAIVTRLGKRPFWSGLEWGWEWARGVRLVSCIVLGVVLFGVGTLIAKMLGADKVTALEQIINSSLATRYAISFLAVFTAPFAEEFVYRGVLFAALKRDAALLVSWVMAFAFGVKLDSEAKERVGVWAAVVLVLILFTIIHVPQYWPNLGVIAAVGLLSVALTLIRAYTGRLLPCVIIHLVFNGVQASLLVLEPFIHRSLPNPDPVVPAAALLLPLVHFSF
jgi:membrane protease YdiL (CAAX protease family)